MSAYSVSAASQDQMNGSFSGSTPQQSQSATAAVSATSATTAAQPLSTQQHQHQQQNYAGQQPNYGSYYMYNQQTSQQGIPEQQSQSQQQQQQGGAVDYNNARYQYMAGAPGTGAATGNNYYQQSNQAYSNRGYPQTRAGAQTAAAAAAAASNPDLLAGSGANSTVGQFQPPGIRPRVTTTMWEDEKTLCYQVDANNVSVVRRADNNMINGTKLLNVAQMTRGRRDGILKSEKVRHVVKIGSMHLKGVWIPFERALSMAQREGIVDLLYPLFVRDIKRVIQTGVTPAAATGGAQQTSPPVNNKMGAGAVQQNYYSQYNQQQQQPQQPQQQYGQQYPTGTPNQGQASIVTPGPTNQQSPQQQNPAVNDPQYQQVYGGYQQQYYNGAIATPNNPNNQYYQGYYNGSTYGQQQAYPYGYQQVQQGIPQQQQQQPMRQQQPLQQHPHQVGDSQTNAQQHTQPPQQVQKSPGKPPPTSDKKEKK